MVLKYAFDIPIPDTVVVGHGVVIPFAGWCFDPDSSIKKLSVSFNGALHPINHLHILRRDVFTVFGNDNFDHPSLFSGFFGVIPFSRDLANQTVDVSLVVQSDNESTSIHIASIYCQLKPEVEQVIDPVITNRNQPLIAICMATYNPELKAFKRQLNSIFAQTHQNWILIINDDHSPEETYQEICKLCAVDPRIYIFRNPTNLNFYHNFEKAIERVGNQVEYIAFSDQDDHWYPEKLSRCLAEMEPGVNLVYSDMRIVKSSGEVIANTYWVNRQNYWDDVALLLLANTVTGAAALFRSSLLEILLPFPYRLGSIYHDHWLSTVARMTGKIRYIDEPLYDYIQHSTNVLGHFDFQAPSLVMRFKRKVKAALKVLLGLRSLSNAEFKDNLDHAWTCYMYDLLRLELLAENLRFRVGANSAVPLSSLDMYRIRWTASFRWLWLHIRVLLTKRTTNHAEWLLLKSYFVVLLTRPFFWLRARSQAFKRVLHPVKIN